MQTLRQTVKSKVRNEVKGENWGTLQFWGQTKQKAKEKTEVTSQERGPEHLKMLRKKGINCCRSVLEMERKGRQKIRAENNLH